MHIHDLLADLATEMRLRDVKSERAVVVTLEPHDVARAGIVQPSGDRAARAGELAHRGLELGQLIFVAAEVSNAFRGERDARDRVREPFAGELHREPALVARAQTRGDACPLLRWSGDRDEERGERAEDLVRTFERALHFGPDAFGGLRARRIAQGRGDREGVPDALEVAAQAGLVELEPKCIS